MKKVVVWGTAFSLLIGGPLLGDGDSGEDVVVVEQKEVVSTAVPVEPFTAQVKGSRVRMRIHPELTAHIVTELNGDDYVIADALDSEFYAVRAPSKLMGYVYRTYVLDGKCEGNHVNVRLSPDIDAPIVAQLNMGDSVVGDVCATNHKWIEIAMPESARFYVAQEFLEKVGGPKLMAEREVRLGEVDDLLHTAYLVSVSEMRKPFDQVDVEKVVSGFQKITKGYDDFPAHVAKAHEILDTVQELYLQKKLAFLEAKTQEAVAGWDMTSSKLSSELALCEQRLKSYQKELGCEGLPASNVEIIPIASAGQEMVEIAVERAVERAQPVEKTPVRLNMTEKMLAWVPVEESLFHSWAVDQEEASMAAFYSEQELDAVELRGVVEPYNRPVMNRPGDHVLKANNRVVAFLYSSHVNLEGKVGQQVRLKAVERPNNRFAFPAYYVLACE